MKKMMFLLIMGLGAAFTACAQKTPPAAVVTAFNQKFPGVQDVDWDKEKNGEWEAEFEEGEVDMSANFSADGKWLETETEIAVSALPQPVRDYLATNFKGKKIKEAAKIITPDGKTTYEAEVKGQGDLLFDAEGKLVSGPKKD